MDNEDNECEESKEAQNCWGKMSIVDELLLLGAKVQAEEHNSKYSQSINEYHQIGKSSI